MPEPKSGGGATKGPPANTEVQPAPEAKRRSSAPGEVTRNLTRERVEAQLATMQEQALLMEKPPKGLLDLDPKKRAAEMVRAA